jgi:alpha-tubulin suppressor-like RCC1 family protein
MTAPSNCAQVTESGELYIWGDTCAGCAGELRHSPQRVLLPPRTMIRAVSLGRAHVLALASSGQLFSWGMGRDGRLGHGDTAHRAGPTMVATLEEAGVGIVSVAAGSAHSLVADTEGGLWSWGCPLEGALGLGAEAAVEAAAAGGVTVPTRIEAGSFTPSDQPEGGDKQVRLLCAGHQTSAAVTMDGE